MRGEGGVVEDASFSGFLLTFLPSKQFHAQLQIRDRAHPIPDHSGIMCMAQCGGVNRHHALHPKVATR